MKEIVWLKRNTLSGRLSDLGLSYLLGDILKTSREWAIEDYIYTDNDDIIVSSSCSLLSYNLCQNLSKNVGGIYGFGVGFSSPIPSNLCNFSGFYAPIGVRDCFSQEVLRNSKIDSITVGFSAFHVPRITWKDKDYVLFIPSWGISVENQRQVLKCISIDFPGKAIYGISMYEGTDGFMQDLKKECHIIDCLDSTYGINEIVACITSAGHVYSGSMQVCALAASHNIPVCYLAVDQINKRNVGMRQLGIKESAVSNGIYPDCTIPNSHVVNELKTNMVAYCEKFKDFIGK